MIPPRTAFRKPGDRERKMNRARHRARFTHGDGPALREMDSALDRGEDLDVEVEELPAEARYLGELLVVVVPELGHQTGPGDRDQAVVRRGVKAPGLHHLAV